MSEDQKRRRLGGIDSCLRAFFDLQKIILKKRPRRLTLPQKRGVYLRGLFFWQKVEGKEKGKAAIPGQGLQAAFPVKPPQGERSSDSFILPEYSPVNLEGIEFE